MEHSDRERLHVRQFLIIIKPLQIIDVLWLISDTHRHVQAEAYHLFQDNKRKCNCNVTIKWRHKEVKTTMGR